MRFAFFSDAGRIATAHNDDTVNQLPVGAVELTAEQWDNRFDLELVGGALAVNPASQGHPLMVASVWEKIKTERDRRRFNGGVNVGAHWFKSDAVATSEYNSLTLLSSALPNDAVLRAAWRTMDGSTVDMTPALVRQILTAGFAAVAAIDDAAMAHKAALEQSPDPAAYDFSGSWPPVFGE